MAAHNHRSIPGCLGTTAAARAIMAGSDEADRGPSVATA
jgi:hypothetical protein